MYEEIEKALEVSNSKQDLVTANVRESQAILGTLLDDEKLMVVQLTFDLKPNILRRQNG